MYELRIENYHAVDTSTNIVAISQDIDKLFNHSLCKGRTFEQRYGEWVSVHPKIEQRYVIAKSDIEYLK